MNKCLNDVWKELDGTEITHSIMHYLFAIDSLLNKNGYARGVDISKELCVTAGSCSVSIKNLIKKGFIKEDENKFILLTQNGKNIVNKAIEKRNVLIKFFEEKLGIECLKSKINACKIEHLLDDEIIKKIKEM